MPPSVGHRSYTSFIQNFHQDFVEEFGPSGDRYVIKERDYLVDNEKLSQISKNPYIYYGLTNIKYDKEAQLRSDTIQMSVDLEIIMYSLIRKNENFAPEHMYDFFSEVLVWANKRIVEYTVYTPYLKDGTTGEDVFPRYPAYLELAELDDDWYPGQPLDPNALYKAVRAVFKVENGLTVFNTRQLEGYIIPPLGEVWLYKFFDEFEHGYEPDRLPDGKINRDNEGNIIYKPDRARPSV